MVTLQGMATFWFGMDDAQIFRREQMINALYDMIKAISG